MQNDTPARIAIVGAGFSGTLLTVQLIRRFTAYGIGAQIYLIEKRDAVSKGLAYQSRNDLHLLNVPAKDMSAFPEEPEHFTNWLAQHYSAMAPTAFAPRSIYGEYLADLLEQSLFESGTVAVEVIRDSADSINKNSKSFGESKELGQQCTLHLKSGRLIQVDKLILATGNFAPKNVLPENSQVSDSYVNDPWSAWLGNLEPDDPILLIGTGLTTIDMVMHLYSRGHRGPITAVSRHGKLPQTHRLAHRIQCLPASLPEIAEYPRTALQLFKAVKNACREAEKTTDANWQMVMGNIRPHIQKIWKGLPDVERKRMLRHVATIWETYRHRMAPEISGRVMDLIAAQQLRILAGRIIDVESADKLVKVKVQHRGGTRVETITAHRVVNCTGPNLDLRTTHDPFLADLINQGAIQPDPWGLGLQSLDCGTVVQAGGTPSTTILAIGSLRRANLYETTAVPELRKQASEIAEKIAAEARVTIESKRPLESRGAIESASQDLTEVVPPR